MPTICQICKEVFAKLEKDYFAAQQIDAFMQNPYPEKSLEHLLYRKHHIDAVQWDLEDIIRDPEINPAEALKLKRRIDKSNQDRTDLVEQIDDYFLLHYADVQVQSNAGINTESPAWAIDRLSILYLKIYHMSKQVVRSEVSEEHRQRCRTKLQVLLEQEKDLTTSIDELIEDIAQGRKYMKVYKQMKMYNAPSLTPVLYGKK